MNIRSLLAIALLAATPYMALAATQPTNINKIISQENSQGTLTNSTNPMHDVPINDIIADYTARYQENRLNAFDMVLNGTTYTFDLPAYTTGYQVKSSSSHNREDTKVTSIFTTTVMTVATVNNEPLHITVNLTKPATDKVLALQELRNATTSTTDEVSKLFTYAEHIDGVKQPIQYDTMDDGQKLIVMKSAHSYAMPTDVTNMDASNIDVANNTRKPISIATFAMTDDVVATITVVSTGNDDEKNNNELQRIVKGTAYAIAASAKTANAAK